MAHLAARYCDSSERELRYWMSFVFMFCKCFFLLCSMRATLEGRGGSRLATHGHSVLPNYGWMVLLRLHLLVLDAEVCPRYLRDLA